jgi:hypothetical protein
MPVIVINNPPPTHMNTRIIYSTLIILLNCICLSLSAQETREDVVYLRDGSIYRGTIIEQIIDQSVTIEDHSRNTHKVLMGDIRKMTKELPQPINTEAAPTIPPNEPTNPVSKIPVDEETPPALPRSRDGFAYPKRGGFFQGEVMIGLVELGMRLTGGYKIGQYGTIGIGVGIENMYTNGAGRVSVYRDFYVPFYLHYAGDMLHERVTPFYAIDLGYSIRVRDDNTYVTLKPFDHPVYNNRGGWMGTAGIGIHAYSTHRLFFTASINLDVKQATNNYTNYYINSSGENIHVDYTTSAFTFLPAFKIGVGF